MKVYISADIEGTCGIVDWEETNLHDPQATYHKEQMTKEVNAACLGVYLHGLAGDKARDIYTEYGVTASRLIENIRGFNS